MATSEQDKKEANPAPLSWVGSIQEQYRKTKQNAEAYPYVWGSYIVVYGGFGLWFAYRWRRFRRTEDRVRVLQERLRKLVESEESTNSASLTNNGPPPSSVDKQPPK